VLDFFFLFQVETNEIYVKNIKVETWLPMSSGGVHIFGRHIACYIVSFRQSEHGLLNYGVPYIFKASYSYQSL
jgi:hypothetical protein